jgi:hypothetical protein
MPTGRTSHIHFSGKSSPSWDHSLPPPPNPTALHPLLEWLILRAPAADYSGSLSSIGLISSPCDVLFLVLQGRFYKTLEPRWLLELRLLPGGQTRGCGCSLLCASRRGCCFMLTSTLKRRWVDSMAMRWNGLWESFLWRLIVVFYKKIRRMGTYLVNM